MEPSLPLGSFVLLWIFAPLLLLCVLALVRPRRPSGHESDEQGFPMSYRQAQAIDSPAQPKQEVRP